MIHRHVPRLALLALATLAACADAPTAVRPDAAEPDLRSQGRGVFHRYVAIGTSISMGWQSDGVYADLQETAWPVQLAALGHRRMSVPRIAAPGCPAPLAAPLALGRRINGESPALPYPSLDCAPNEPGVRLPADNVAINGARTSQALHATPENPDPNNARLYARVLPPGMSQVDAMEAQNPKIVSVELGGNEVLGARNGYYLPGVNVVPVAYWEPDYLKVLDRVQATAKHGLLVGLIDDAASFPSFRRGAELWDARATFLPLNVLVSEDCAGNGNLLFVAVRVPVAAAEGAARFEAGAGPATLSCQNHPPTYPPPHPLAGTPITDYVLGPAELAQVNAQLAAMNAVIRREAQRRGFAYMELGALYEDANVKAPFSAVALMTSPQPYGPYISLDGVHPSPAGHAVLAAAAAAALNERYRFGMPTMTTLAAALGR